jgi:hypothetical protein
MALLAGCGAGSNADSPPATGAPASAQVPVSPEAPAPAGDPATPARMDDAAFWQLIADTRAAAGNDTGRQSELLEQRLRHLPAEQIAQFEQIRQGLDEQAYSWDLWAAAYVIEDGCSDDCFRDFRGYLISLGRGPYEGAQRDPDSLASVAQDAETGDWENADDVAPDAYESVADEDIPTGDSEPSGDPSGQPWDDKQQDALVARYPKLAARFR